MSEIRDQRIRRLRRDLESFEVSGGWQSPPTHETGKWHFEYPYFEVPDSMPVDRSDQRFLIEEAEKAVRFSKDTLT